MRMDANASSGMLGRKRCRPACSPHQLMGAGGQVFRTRNIRLKTSRTLFGDVTNTLSRHRILIAKDDRKSYMPHRNALDCPYVLSLVLQWLDTRALCTLLSCNRRLKEKLDSMKNLWQKIRISDVGIRLSQLNELFMRTSLRQPLLMMSLRDTRIMLDDEIPYEIAPKLLRLKSIRIETCNRASLLLREMLPCSVGLKHLEILDCPSVCVNSISSVISSYSGKIKTLKIAGCGGRPLDQDEARVLVDCCPDIEQLSMMDFVVNDRSAAVLLQLKNLVHLDLTDNEDISGKFLVGTESKSIKSLVLRDCTELNVRGHLDEFVRRLIEGSFPNLSSIDTSCQWADHGESMLKNQALKRQLALARPEIVWCEDHLKHPPLF
ncbi:hypothetical protein AAMO2058_000824500 [Amorphochlora amoebiformis]